MSGRHELVFGLVGPIGSPVHEAHEALKEALTTVGYGSTSISLSSSMDDLLSGMGVKRLPSGKSILQTKIRKGNAVRAEFKSNSVLAAEAIRRIRSERVSLNTHLKKKKRSKIPVESHAFIIDQLKRPEEISLLLRTFGKRFIQISVASPLELRRSSLINRLLSEQHGWTSNECERHADDLILTDQEEKNIEHGQLISKIFHLGDVFIDGRNDTVLRDSTERFIRALFGRNNIGPTRDEFGSYIAKAASLRSVDLSRQVGAAICSDSGDLISIGCNEVPRAGGGNYWDEDTEKRRDIDLGGEANKREVNRIVFDFIEVLRKRRVVRKKKGVDSLLSDPELRKAIKGALVSGITEYGRMVHAEMNALSDASRLGRSTLNSTIFVTTYPCHNCAKHLIAAGIRRIVYIEPYPKSRAEDLYRGVVSRDDWTDGKVVIEHFYGISPRRFRDIFEKESRQSSDGKIDKWYNGLKEPRLGPIAISGTDQELFAIRENLYPDDP